MTLPDLRTQLLARAHDDNPGLVAGAASWTWRDAVAQSNAVGAVLAQRLDPALPPHVGVLLPNTPDFVFALGAAALWGHVVVGLNPTRRGAALAADVQRADCQVVLCDATYADRLAGLGVAVVRVDEPGWRDDVATCLSAPMPDVSIGPDTLAMLIFTSGTSGDPKAVRVTHSKVAYPGEFLSERFGLTSSDVVYCSMPLFHSNAVMAAWGPALAVGASVALAERFSASGFLPDVRRYGATYANYVGKPLAYVMATPEQPDDADNPLRLMFGNEANERDIAAFGRRFGCVVVDSYSSTENAVIVQRVPDMPPGSLGRPVEGVRVLNPDTLAETPDAIFDAEGRLLNAEEATGELVNSAGAGAFAGYYNDPDADAERMRGGMYWSGDLAYRDSDGFVYFAGRTSDWLRVNGENIGAAPIERVLLRHPAISEAAVYAVAADDGVGDQVAAALILTSDLTAEAFGAFLAQQADLSPLGWPTVVRILDALPRTATNKVLKRSLAADGVENVDGVRWRRAPRAQSYSNA